MKHGSVTALGSEQGWDQKVRKDMEVVGGDRGASDLPGQPGRGEGGGGGKEEA